MLQLIKIKKKFTADQKSTSVLTSIDVTFEKNHSYALTGPSGSGKSTLMHIIAGIDTPTKGSVLLNHKDLSFYTDLERAQKITLVTQHPFLIKELSVIENICLAGSILKLPQHATYAHACELLKIMHLQNLRDAPIRELSGGQQHRVALARALLVKPAFLCADEITGSLDEKTGQEIIMFLKKYCKEEGIGLIISSHNPNIIEHMDLVFALKDGILTFHQSSFTKKESNEFSRHTRSSITS